MYLEGTLQSAVQLLEALPMSTANADTSLPILNLVRLLTASFKMILVVGVAGAVAGLLASQVIHPRWTATMAIQIGQVSTPSFGAGASMPQPIENQLTATERYNLPGFRLQVHNELGLPAPETGSQDANLLFDSLKAAAGRSPNVINVQVTAYSRDVAAAALDAALKTFSAAHRELFERASREMQSTLVEAQTKLAAAQQDYARINQMLKAAASEDRGGVREVLLSNTAVQLNSQILALQQQIAAYQDALGPLRSYPTKAIGPAYAPMRSTTPGAPILVLLGAVLGLTAGVGFALLNNAIRDPRAPN
ncbi:hypothetical protein GCM10009079_36340 [Ralstonia mannitolilytica]